MPWAFKTRRHQRIHEVVDADRHISQLTELENAMKAATEVDRYIKPSLALYHSLRQSFIEMWIHAIPRKIPGCC